MSENEKPTFLRDFVEHLVENQESLFKEEQPKQGLKLELSLSEEYAGTLTEEEKRQTQETANRILKRFREISKRKGIEAPKMALSLHGRNLTNLAPLGNLEVRFLSDQEARGNSEATIKNYKWHFKALYKFFAYHYSADDVSAQEKFDYKNNYVKYGRLLPILILNEDMVEVAYRRHCKYELKLADASIQCRLRTFRVIAYYAMEHGLIDKRNIKIKSSLPSIKEVYTDKEIAKLLVKPDINNFPEYRNWVIINYLFGTGNRRRSVINLKVGDIDFDQKVIRVNVQKNNIPQEIGLNSRLEKILKEYIESYRADDDGYYLGEYLFCSRLGQQLTPDGLTTIIQKYNKSRGVQKTSIHLFRHTFAKDWILAGKDILMLQKVLGHESIQMVQHYANLYGRDTRNAVNDNSILERHKPKKRKVITRRILPQ